MSSSGKSHFDGTEPYRSHGASHFDGTEAPTYARGAYGEAYIAVREQEQGHSNSHPYHNFYTCNAIHSKIKRLPASYKAISTRIPKKRKRRKQKKGKLKTKSARTIC
jgi:hypothetical protein